MKFAEWLKQAAGTLKEAGIASARLDALILAEDCTHKDRAYLLAHPEHKLSETQIGRLNRQIKRRLAGEPLSYIRGFTEFYGRRFKLNRYVLEPRPESETMIELLLKLPLPAKAAIADIGTGSGALGITAAIEIPDSTVDLYDIDSTCLAVARHNCTLHELALKTYKRDLLSRPAGHYDVVLANLPYLLSTEELHPSVLKEPKIALLGGPDGLDLYRRMFEQLSKLPDKPRFILTESLPPQHAKLNHTATQAGYKLLQSQDLIQVFSSQSGQLLKSPAL